MTHQLLLVSLSVVWAGAAFAAEGPKADLAITGMKLECKSPGGSSKTTHRRCTLSGDLKNLGPSEVPAKSLVLRVYLLNTGPKNNRHKEIARDIPHHFGLKAGESHPGFEFDSIEAEKGDLLIGTGKIHAHWPNGEAEMDPDRNNNSPPKIFRTVE